MSTTAPALPTFSVNAPPIRMMCVIRKTMKIGSRNVTDSLMPRRLSTISASTANDSKPILH